MWIFLVIITIAVIIYLMTKDEKKQRINTSFRNSYPNFQRVLEDVYNKEVSLYADTDKVVTYRTSIIGSGRIVGYTYFILSHASETNYLRLTYKGNDRIEVISDQINLNTKKDLSKEEYKDSIVSLITEIMGNPKFIKSTTGLVIDDTY